MIYVILILLLVWLGYAIWDWRRNPANDENLAGAVFCLIPYLLIVSLITLGNGAGLAKWQVFYNTNSNNYAVTIDKTASYLSVEEFAKQVLLEGSIEKMQLATAVSDRIAEWRTAVNEYNTTIASMQYFNRNIFTGVLVPDGVEEMKPLIIKW